MHKVQYRNSQALLSELQLGDRTLPAFQHLSVEAEIRVAAHNGWINYSSFFKYRFTTNSVHNITFQEYLKSLLKLELPDFHRRQLIILNYAGCRLLPQPLRQSDLADPPALSSPLS